MDPLHERGSKDTSDPEKRNRITVVDMPSNGSPSSPSAMATLAQTAASAYHPNFVFSASLAANLKRALIVRG
jgi:hypothetical protein